MVKHVDRRSRGIKDMRLMHPYRDWVIILAVVFCILVSGLIFSYLIHKHYSEIGNNVVAESIEPVAYDANTANKVLDYYRLKASKVEAILRNYVPEDIPDATEDKSDNATPTTIGDIESF